MLTASDFSLLNPLKSGVNQNSTKTTLVKITVAKSRYHFSALELSANIVGFKSFNEALKINEDNARYAIYEENRKKQIAAKKEKDYIEEEYKKYIKSK